MQKKFSVDPLVGFVFRSLGLQGKRATTCESWNRAPDLIILKDRNNWIYLLRKGLNFGFDRDYYFDSQNMTNSVSTALGVIFIPSILNSINLMFDSNLVFHLGFVGIFFFQLANIFAVYLNGHFIYHSFNTNILTCRVLQNTIIYNII